MADSCWMPLNTSIKFSLRSLNYQMHCTIRCNTKSFQVRRAVFRSVYWQKYNIMIIIIIYVGLTSRWFLTHMNGRNITYWHLAGFCLTKWLEFWLHNVSLRDVCDAWTRNAASSRNMVDCGVKCRCFRLPSCQPQSIVIYRPGHETQQSTAAETSFLFGRCASLDQQFWESLLKAMTTRHGVLGA